MSTAKTRFRCSQCDKTEDRCECDRYCYMCMGQYNNRLCQDGLYYCQACREACDYHTDD
jgi:hypothetical protein